MKDGNKNLNSYYKNFHINTYKFILYLFMVTIVMMFTALTSAYIVKQSHGNWFYFKLPFVLWINSLIILFSSIFIQFSYFFLKKNNFFFFNFFIILTLIFSLFFLFGQYKVWLDLISKNIYFTGNPSGSFLYVFIGLHAFHLVSGIIFIIFVWIFSFLNSKKRIFYLKICTTYWHFLGLLWIYLYLFLILNH